MLAFLESKRFKWQYNTVELGGGNGFQPVEKSAYNTGNHRLSNLIQVMYSIGDECSYHALFLLPKLMLLMAISRHDN